jgi:hypothetical protein
METTSSVPTHRLADDLRLPDSVITGSIGFSWVKRASSE